MVTNSYHQLAPNNRLKFFFKRNNYIFTYKTTGVKYIIFRFFNFKELFFLFCERNKTAERERRLEHRSAARPLLLAARRADEESLEEEQLHVAAGDDEEAERRRPPGDVPRVGQQQEVVGAPAHAADAVVAEDVEDVVLHTVSRFLRTVEISWNRCACCSCMCYVSKT